MAKKVLTPEEVQAKMEKKAAKRKLFFGTFTKALAFFLAIAIAWSLAAIAFTPAVTTTTVGGATPQGGTTTQTGGATQQGGTTTTPDASTPGTPSGDAGSSDAATVDGFKAVNDATKAAAGKSYTWTRTGAFTQDVAIDPSFLTGAVDSIIKAVDENSDLNSVVGGFLGINGGTKTADIVNGKRAEDSQMNNDKYLLMATSLTSAHGTCTVSGNTYTIKLNQSLTPTGNGATAIEHATNDYITLTEVNEGIASVTTAISVKEDGSSSDYNNIIITAVIEDGALKSYKVEYDFSAVLNLSIGAKGTGAAHVCAEYTNFK